jgi:non-canonical (house-cleaning) NTP pyrophosphatase
MNLGFDIRFSTNTVIWDTVEIPMKSQDTAVEPFHLSDPDFIQEATARVQEILEAKYTVANLRGICNKSIHLYIHQQEQLFAVLTKSDSKPCHANTFSIPKIHLETLKAKVQHLCDLGVLKKVNHLE